MSDNRIFNPEEKMKLKQMVNDAVATMSKVNTLNEGLSDTIKETAKELDIKASVLRKAVRVAYKATMDEETTDFELMENILESSGRKSEKTGDV